MFSRDRPAEALHADGDASDDDDAYSGASTPRKTSVMLPRRSVAASVFGAAAKAAPATWKAAAAPQVRISTAGTGEAAPPQEQGGRGSLGADAKPRKPAADSMAPAGVGPTHMQAGNYALEACL